MRSRFDEQLALLNRELIEMGALCEEAIAKAAKALSAADRRLAEQVAPLDSEIDRKEREIESLCLKLLLQQQLQAERLDLALLAVDLAVERRDLFGQTAVGGAECLGGLGDGLLAQRAHFDQLPVEQRELLVKSTSHQPNLPVI